MSAVSPADFELQGENMTGSRYSFTDQPQQADDSFQNQKYISKKDEPVYTGENGEVDGKVSGNPDGDNGSNAGSDKDKEKETVNMVGMGELFRFADSKDVLMMVVGSIAALLHGAALPLMIIVFGEMSDSFIYDAVYKDWLDEYYPNISMYTNYTYDELLNDPGLLGPAMEAANMTDEWDEVMDLVGKNILDEMQQYAVYYAILGVCVIVFGYLQLMCWQIASYRQAQRIRVALFEAILRQEIGWFDTHEVGELNTRLSDDVNKIQEGIGEKIAMFFQWFSAFITGFIVGFVFGWELTLVILAVSPLLAISGGIMSKLGASITSQELKAYAKAGAVAEEVLGAIRTVVAFSGEKKECERYRSNLGDARYHGEKKGKVNGVAMGIIFFIMFATYALAFWYGSSLVRDGGYSAGDLLVVFFCVLIGAFSIGNAMPNLQNLATSRGAAYTVYQIIDMESSIDSSSEEGIKPPGLKGNIEFRDVVFSYPSRSELTILNSLSLKVNVGQTVALVGASGCGKSTTVQLIQRFYDPAQGEVLIDGTSVKDYNLKWLRSKIGVVSQEPVLFGTTIAENIRYGRDGITQEEIEKATREANAHNFITQLPQQYQTLVGERGAQLSGGQKQRIAIARALVRDPKIILLDEATSALDTESESIVQAALDKAGQGRTTIVVAHRLSTVRNADIICGFKDGVVTEFGTHDELMKKQGIYYTLVTNQTNAEDDELLGGALKQDLTRSFSVQSSHSHGDKQLSRQLSGSSPKHAASKTSRERTLSTSSDAEDEDLPPPNMMRVFKMNLPEWYLIVIGCFCAIISGIIQPAFAVIFAEILGVFSERDLDKQKEQTDKYSLMFLGLGVIAGLAMFFQSVSFAYSGEALTMRLRDYTFTVLLGQDIAYFDDHKNSVGALTTRLATDASAVQGATGVRVAMMVQSLSSIGTGLIIGFIFSWQLTLLILAFTPFVLAGGAVQTKVMVGNQGEAKEALEKAGKVAVEAIGNIRTVANLVKEDTFHKEYVALTEGPYKKSLKAAHVQGFAYGFSQGVIFFAYAACFTFGAWLVDEGKLNYVELFKVFGAIVFSAMSAGQASSFAPDYGKCKNAAARLLALYDREPAIDSYSEEGDKLPSYDGSVQFSDVAFNYPTRPDVAVLQGVEFSVKPGQMVALVGSSGCGKSTIVQLIERFYDTLSGQVMVDNRDIRGLHIQWLRGQMGLVQQEPILFDYSLRENIAYGDNSRDVQMSEVIEAAKMANIHNFITTLPQGYETSVGDKGAQLSGGQKQRVAIARALVRNPKILLLDEATSALDTESEKIVQEALDRAQEGRTSIVIAHRLSTIHNADRIVVLRSGQVIESGTHSELLAQQGFYFKLNQIQVKKGSQ